MPTIPLGISGPSYESGVNPVAYQQAVNLYAEVQEARGREKVVMRRTPGLESFAAMGKSVCRGLLEVNGTLLAVYGTTLYTVEPDGTPTARGTITGNDRVKMADNGDYVVVVANSIGWYYRISTKTFAQITDVDFGTPIDVAYLDGFWLFVDANSRQVFYNQTANDPTSYDGTDIFQKAGDGSNLRGLFVNHRDLFLLGEKATEVWRSVADVDTPFQRLDGSEMERGCLAKHSTAEMDNSFFFLGDDRVVYRIEGYQPVRVSNHAIENWLAGLSESEAIAAVGFTYTYRGHYFYALRAGGSCFVYDATASAQTGQSLWHERKSGTAADRIWRVNAVVQAFGREVAGDDSGSALWKLDHDGFQENGENTKWIRTCPPIYEGMATLFYSAVELFVNAGVGSLTEDPLVWLETSDDGGRTWSARRQRGIGKSGKYANRAIWRRNGSAVQRIHRFSGTDNYDIALIDGQVEVEMGV